MAKGSSKGSGKAPAPPMKGGGKGKVAPAPFKGKVKC